MEYSRTFSAVPGNFRKKRKKFLTNPTILFKSCHNIRVLSMHFKTTYILQTTQAFEYFWWIEMDTQVTKYSEELKI